jgi:hypothetical protein
MKCITNWIADFKRKRQLKRAPKDLWQAVHELYVNSDESDRNRFMREPSDHPGSQFHFGSGMAMRNIWGLWIKEQPLTQWFRSHGIWHADDMCALIYKAYWCSLHDKRFDIDKEAQHYKDYWTKQGVGFDGEKL